MKCYSCDKPLESGFDAWKIGNAPIPERFHKQCAIEKAQEKIDALQSCSKHTIEMTIDEKYNTIDFNIIKQTPKET